MKIVETTLNLPGLVGPSPKASVAIATTGGEIRMSILHGDSSTDFTVRPTAPPHNIQNAAAALAESVVLNRGADALITIALLNSSAQAVTAKVELACYSGAQNTKLTPLIDEQEIALPSGQSWTSHALIKLI